MINQVVLVGRLVRDPELKYTPTNIANSRFTLAVNRPFKNAAGEHEADFINCLIWRKGAENFIAYCKKGNLIGVTGRIQTGSYENQQGQRIYTTDVIVDTFHLMESKAAREKPQEPPAGNWTPGGGSVSDSAPADPFSGGAPMDILDDDLPF